MLRVLDADAGTYIAVTPAHPGLLRVRAEVPPLDLTAARVLLVADLLFRSAGLRQVRALVAWAFRDQSGKQAAAAARAASALNIHPPAEATMSFADLHVISDGATLQGSTGGIHIRVAGAHPPGKPGHHDFLAGHDPLAVRLALMSCPYHQPAELTDGVLADARETLGQWRRQVAAWAESPSRPVPERVAAAFGAALAELDTATVLTLLHGLVPDEDVPAGARFETFMLADRVLGLDLARDIGRVRAHA